MTKKLTEVDTIEIQLYDNIKLDSSEGYENVTRSDFSTPYLKLIQKTSDKIIEQVPDAKYGDIYNSVSSNVYDGKEGVLCSLCYFEVMYVEMIPFEEGGGVVDFHKTLANLDIKNDKGKWVTRNGTHILQSNYHYIKVWKPECLDAVVIMSSTQIKKSKMWISISKSLRAIESTTMLPMYHGVYKLTSCDEVRNNMKFKGWKIAFEKHPTIEQLTEARNLYLAVKEAKLNDTRRPYPLMIDTKIIDNNTSELFDDTV